MLSNLEPLVSVIVPVYNSGKYLDKCIESLLSQTYYNIEVLLIDDGSTDNSNLICTQYSKIDNRNIVYTKSNGGVASSRNTGLNYASGQFLMFCDSDDWVSKDWVEKMVRAMMLSPTCSLVINVNAPKKMATKSIIDNDWYNVFLEKQIGVVWNKVFSADIIKKYHIRFKDGLSYGEDKIFVVEYLIAVKERIERLSFRIVEANLYYHCDENKMSLSKQYTDRSAFLELEAGKMKEFGETYGLDKESIMQYLEIKKDISIIENMHCVLGESRLLELYPRMKAIMRSDKFRQAIMNPRIKKKVFGQ